MAAILVNYDLNAPGQKYADVTEVLQSYAGWAHVGGSSWIVVGVGITPVSVRDAVRAVVDDGDTILTVDISSTTYAGLLTQELWDWLGASI
jgi:hypothetical protein